MTQAIDLEKNFVKYISNKRCVPRITKLRIWQTPICQWRETKVKKKKKHENMCNIFSYQGNADQSHNDVLFTLTRMAEIKKTDYNKWT